MKNADMPAMPQSEAWQRDMEARLDDPNVSGHPPIYGIGLTKREWIAALAMQGLLAKHGYPDVRDFSGYNNPDELHARELHYAAQDLADYSRICADKLLWEIEEFPYAP